MTTTHSAHAHTPTQWLERSRASETNAKSSTSKRGKERDSHVGLKYLSSGFLTLGQELEDFIGQLNPGNKATQNWYDPAVLEEVAHFDIPPLRLRKTGTTVRGSRIQDWVHIEEGEKSCGADARRSEAQVAPVADMGQGKFSRCASGVLIEEPVGGQSKSKVKMEVDIGAGVVKARDGQAKVFDNLRQDVRGHTIAQIAPIANMGQL
ncbi:hypothetical protein EDC01DRAFT_774980 [Geopyxis carbonaria]|nr:hypothetical protein EDC01DRAFT_774980 [Geopyxis carbonaria]